MGITTGNGGVVKSGSTTIAEVLSWSVSETAATIDTTQLSDTARTFTVGTTQWSADFECMWDPADTGQDTLTIGASITIHFYGNATAGSEATGDEDWTGTLLITSITTSGALDDTAKASISGQGTGTLTKTTVS